MGSVISSYIYSENVEEMVPSEIERYILKRDVWFYKLDNQEYYKAIIRGNDSVYKVIPEGTSFYIKKLLVRGKNGTRIIGQFDQERYLFDVTIFFKTINPIIHNSAYIKRDVKNASVSFIDITQIVKDDSIDIYYPNSYS